jgi:predicted 2-oxoglutarate/Fe(II)-dependent dioxygenase YbiX
MNPTTFDFSGDVVVFPSLFLFPHRIEEVTENIRYSGVAWGC